MIKYLILPIAIFFIACEKNHVEKLMLDQPSSKEEVILYEKELGSTLFETTYNGVPPKQGLNDSIIYEESLMFVNEKASPLPLKSKYY